jgi:hypothetical protein
MKRFILLFFFVCVTFAANAGDIFAAKVYPLATVIVKYVDGSAVSYESVRAFYILNGFVTIQMDMSQVVLKSDAIASIESK